MKRFHRFDVLLQWFKEFKAGHFTERTIKDYDFEIGFFKRWLEEKTDIQDIDEIKAEIIHDYSTTLFDRRLAPKTIHHKMSALVSFFKTLYEENKLYTNLAVHVQLPKVGKSLPTGFFEQDEIKKVFDHLELQTDNREVKLFDDALAYRDRAMFEIFYSSGIRKGELIGLRLGNIKFGDGLLDIKGKGNKDRVVPIGQIPLDALENYLSKARPKLAKPDSPDAVFLTKFGQPIGYQSVKDAIDKIQREAKISKHVKVHGLRHSCATHLLDQGADIRHVQELLGHECLSSTQVYTHVSIKGLRDAHRRCHPRERDNFALVSDNA